VTEGPERREWAGERDAILEWLVAHDFAGDDPFDALESRFFQRTPLRHHAFARLAWLQLHKRLPFNLRSLVEVPRTRNPKALGLVLSGLARRTGKLGSAERSVGGRLVSWLAESRAAGSAGWAYPFSWQNRAFFAPEGTPNAICSAFVVNGLLDYAEAGGGSIAAEQAEQALPFFLRELTRTETTHVICFSYTPRDRSRIHNVNLIVAATILRLVHHIGPSREAEDLVQAAVGHSVAAQRKDGAWYYGDAQRHRWIDSYHTGYNLDALQRLAQMGEPLAAEARKQGYAYFRAHLLDGQGRVKHYDRSLYPIDVHVVAQGILTLLGVGDLDKESPRMAKRVAYWGCRMLREAPGVYGYQRGRFFRNRTVHARWGQAWMFRALCELENTCAV
jgi:hypothetical protein